MDAAPFRGGSRRKQPRWICAGARRQCHAANQYVRSGAGEELAHYHGPAVLRRGVMDAVAPSETAAKQVDVALADLNKALKGLEWSAEFSRLSGDPAAESLTALWQVLAG